MLAIRLFAAARLSADSVFSEVDGTFHANERLVKEIKRRAEAKKESFTEAEIQSAFPASFF